MSFWASGRGREVWAGLETALSGKPQGWAPAAPHCWGKTGGAHWESHPQSPLTPRAPGRGESMARVLLAECVPHTLVLRGDHLSLQAGRGRGRHQLWGEQGRGAAPCGGRGAGRGPASAVPLLWRLPGSDRLKLLAEPQPLRPWARLQRGHGAAGWSAEGQHRGSVVLPALLHCGAWVLGGWEGAS